MYVGDEEGIRNTLRTLHRRRLTVANQPHAAVYATELRYEIMDALVIIECYAFLADTMSIYLAIMNFNVTYNIGLLID